MVRRFPLPVFGLLLAETFAFALAVGGRNVALLPFIATEVAFGCVAAALPRRVSRAAGVICLAALVVFWVTRSLTDDFSLRSSSGVWTLSGPARAISTRTRGSFCSRERRPPDVSSP
jgi:hypothetical protein